MAKKAKSGSSKNGSLRTYRSYLFVDKDPIIDALRTAVSESHKSYTEIHAASDVSVGTMRNWFHGKTRRPMFSSVSAVVRALGKRNIRYTSKGVPHLGD